MYTICLSSVEKPGDPSLESCRLNSAGQTHTGEQGSTSVSRELGRCEGASVDPPAPGPPRDTHQEAPASDIEAEAVTERVHSACMRGAREMHACTHEDTVIDSL